LREFARHTILRMFWMEAFVIIQIPRLKPILLIERTSLRDPQTAEVNSPIHHTTS
jgi:hypothetical protein